MRLADIPADPPCYTTIFISGHFMKAARRSSKGIFTEPSNAPKAVSSAVPHLKEGLTLMQGMKLSQRMTLSRPASMLPYKARHVHRVFGGRIRARGMLHLFKVVNRTATEGRWLKYQCVYPPFTAHSLSSKSLPESGENSIFRVMGRALG